MKNILHIRKLTFFFLFALFIMNGVFAQNDKEIVFVYDAGRIDDSTGEGPDIPMMRLFEEQGYTVHKFPTFMLANATEEQIDSLNNADLVYIGRAVGSANFQSPSKEIWHSIKAPVMTGNMWALRGSRCNWFNSEATANINDLDATIEANIEDESDPVFEGLASPILWWSGSYSILNVQEAGNGMIMASKSDDGSALFVRFEPFVEFYPGTDEYPEGERVYFGNGADGATDENGQMIYNYFGFSDDIKKVFLNEVGRLTGTFDPVGVDVKKMEMNPSVYPVPANHTLTIKMENLSKVNVLDIAGRQVSSHVTSGTTMRIDVSNLNKGVYFLKVIDVKGNSVIRKITKE